MCINTNKMRKKIFIIGIVLMIVVLFYFVYNLNAYFPEPDLKEKLERIINVSEIDYANTSINANVDNENISMKIIIFSDFECPACGMAEPIISKLRNDYGDIEFEFHHVPLNTHQNARHAAEAAECARDQGKFWEMHDLLFEKSHFLEMESLIFYGEKLGLDSSYDSCLRNHEKKDYVVKQMKEAFKIGVKGTPSFMINGKIYEGYRPYEEFVEIIERNTN